MSPSRTCNCGWEDRTNNKGKVCPYCKLNNSVPSLTPALRENHNPATEDRLRRTCPGCQREHYIDLKNWGDMKPNPTHVYCPTCVFKIED